ADRDVVEAPSAQPFDLQQRRLAAVRHVLRREGGVERPTDDQSKKVGDRKSTRLNSSHVSISYAVFCLKKKKNKTSNFALVDLKVSEYPAFQTAPTYDPREMLKNTVIVATFSTAANLQRWRTLFATHID